MRLKALGEAPCSSCPRERMTAVPADDAGHNHNALESLGRSAVFVLSPRKDDGGAHNHSHLGQFRRLELYAHKSHPAGGPVDAVARHHTGNHNKSQQNDRHQQQRIRKHLEPFVGNVVYQHHNQCSDGEQDGVLRDGSPMVTALIGQRRSRREHFDNGNEAECQEDNPYHFVAFEYAS